MKGVTVLLAVVFLSAAVHGKVFQRCQLVKLLRDTYHMPHLATWVMDLTHGPHIQNVRAMFSSMCKDVSNLKNAKHCTLHQSITRNNKVYKVLLMTVYCLSYIPCYHNIDGTKWVQTEQKQYCLAPPLTNLLQVRKLY
ncbi:unnamed protein product [Callosobruchus maculatus]|uniref:Uncharacterized protein n=1 Tax=Callosobruchus maculatus TaxID=64391 RepID=A0A653BSV3_CALMS|nr:unnamed protein product [Callosobruchus maculatus]